MQYCNEFDKIGNTLDFRVECSNCKGRMSAEDKFCRFCGRELEKVPECFSVESLVKFLNSHLDIVRKEIKEEKF